MLATTVSEPDAHSKVYEPMLSNLYCGQCSRIEVLKELLAEIYFLVVVLFVEAPKVEDKSLPIKALKSLPIGRCTEKTY